MRAISRILAVLTLLALALSSCKEPSCDFFLLSSDRTSEDGGYCFEVELTDTTASYLTLIAARFNAKMIEKADSGTFPLNVTVTSPGGEVAAESIRLPFGDVEGKVKMGRQINGTVDIEWQYRDNVRISGNQSGIWKINLRPVDKGLEKYLVGLGFSYKKH